MAWHFVFTVIDTREVSISAFRSFKDSGCLVAQSLNAKEANELLGYLRDRQDEMGWTMEGTENLRGLDKVCELDPQRIECAIREIEQPEDENGPEEGDPGEGGVGAPVKGPPPARPFADAKIPARN